MPPSEELVVIPTGEVVSLDDAHACARALGDVRQLEQRLRELKQALTDAIIAECERQGTQTLILEDGTKAILGGGSETQWDVATLEQLRDLGLPEDRFNDLVTAEISYKVNAREAKHIAAANPEYAKVVAAAQSKYEKPRYVSLRRQAK